MPKFLVPGNQATLTTTYKTGALIHATTGALARGAVTELMMGPTGVPNATDCSIQWDMSKITAAGTSTAFTPNPADNLATALATAGVNATVEPTVTANSSRFNIGANQRQCIRWFAGAIDDELWFPATANNGFALRGLSTNYAASVATQINFRE